MNASNKTASGHPIINVFTYGSLMYADVFKQVTGCVPISVPARAHRWQRYGLRGLTYPGACPVIDQASFIDGVLWLDVSNTALAALDLFEGEQYRRELINVAIASDRSCCAYIYEWLLPDLMQGDWDPQIFEREHLHGFAQTHAARQK